jgi:Ca2+-binding RTX toxin-like protein
MAGMKLYYEASGTWSAVLDGNAGDPLGAGTGVTFNLAGYTLTKASYENLDTQHHILSLGVGHKALLLDDDVTGAQGAQGRIIGIDVINGNSGGQIIDLTSETITYGNVTINGGTGNDVLMANAGNDSIKGGGGADYAWGGTGNDSITGGVGNDIVLGATGDDWLSGGVGNDKITTGVGADFASGGKGDDSIYAGLGNQNLAGNTGFDTLDLFKVAAKATIDQGTHTLRLVAGGVIYQSQISGFEKIYGTELGTEFIGQATHASVLIGGSAADVFHLNGGGDTLSGKGGADVYDWNKKSEAVSAKADIIKDFVVGTDKLDLHDFLKGQSGMKLPAYDQVVHVVNSSDGVMVQALVNGKFHDVVDLVGIHTHVLADLLLM